MRTIKKIALLLLMALLSLRSMAPTAKLITITRTEPVQPYEKLIQAIATVETKGDTLAYNPVEEAVGIFQIRPIRLEDYNKRTGSHYTMKDLYSYKISRKIFLYYASMAGPNEEEKVARSWNGSGVKTYYYWQRVKKHL
jgi:hypothetical protein